MSCRVYFSLNPPPTVRKLKILHGEKIGFIQSLSSRYYYLIILPQLRFLLKKSLNIENITQAIISVLIFNRQRLETDVRI